MYLPFQMDPQQQGKGNNHNNGQNTFNKLTQTTHMHTGSMKFRGGMEGRRRM